MITRPVQQTDADSIARVHERALPWSINGRLGHSHLKGMYERLLSGPDCVGYVSLHKDEIIAFQISTTDWEAALAFYLMLLYYPFTTESRDIFSANAPTAVFLDWLRGMRDESHRECARYEYLIIRASEHPSIRTTAAGIMYCTGTRTTPCSIRSMRAMETV